MLKHLDKAPFPYFGGKRDAAAHVWRALGDVHHYVEPFAGSLAVLLCRPHEANRPYHSETVNDSDGLLVNAWRAIQLSPEATADAASWPVSEADLTARHLALVRWRTERELEHLMGDPHFHDPVMAGWWLWGLCSWIGGGWCDGTGPWRVGADGRIEKMVRAPRGTREPGVKRQRPHLADAGQGVNSPGTREPGVSRQLPVLSGNGQGVNQPGTREPGVKRQRPLLISSGQGVNRPSTREPGTDDGAEFHPVTMPELLRWFRFLSARLRHVRIVNGDWQRVLTPSVVKTLSVRNGKGTAGIFLDPPYGDVRAAGLYAHDSLTVADSVRRWCLENGNDPRVRIVLAGFVEEHSDLESHGWRCVPWFRSGFLKGGMAQQGCEGTKQHKERLWLSPACIDDDADADDEPDDEPDEDTLQCSLDLRATRSVTTTQGPETE